MKKEKEPNFGFPSEKSREELIEGLQGAIEATKRSIADYKANNWDASELESHLESLEERLEAVKNK